MHLEKCSINDLYSLCYKRTKNEKILEEFVNSDMEIAEVKEYTNKDAKSCSNSLNISIKRFHMTGIKSILRNEKVYLIKINNVK